MKFICNCESIQACAGMPALEKEREREKGKEKLLAVTTKMFFRDLRVLESGVWNRQGRGCSEGWGGALSPQPLLHLTFLLQKVSPASFPSEVESSS